MPLPDEKLAQFFQLKEVDKIKEIVARLIEESGSAHPKQIFEELNPFMNYRNFLDVLKACIKTNRIKEYQLGAAGIIYPNDAEITNKSDIHFSEEQLGLIQEIAKNLLKSKRRIQREELYEKCKAKLPNIFTLNVFLREFRENLSLGKIAGIRSKRGKRGGLCLDVPDELLDAMMGPEGEQSHGSLRPRSYERPRTEFIDVQINSSNKYKVPITQEELSKLIINVLKGKGVSNDEANISFKERKFFCPDLKTLDRYLSSFYGEDNSGTMKFSSVEERLEHIRKNR